MNTFINKINENLRQNKLIYLIITAVFIVGVVLGVYSILYMSQASKNDVMSYFNSFVSSVSDKQINYKDLIIESLKNNLIFFIGILLLGFIIVGAPFVLIIVLVKGFLIGFSFSLLVNILGNRGVGLALIALVPQNIVIVPFIIICSSLAVQFSMAKLKSKFTKSVVSNEAILSYVNFYLFSAIFLVAGIFLETYIVPNLMKIIIKKFYV
ncbi:stage II sporulation protein M [Clostridium folliculivorans]|uniref:stage II sporulation protein M n=1 Tax=Clostridium folliculivorans TaxID=2886038 RepID=UPI0021C49EAF|nr:stage II sporulation protein M [Clostridium folliculivorans]GKU30129.1 stage II sporulation protein M [Clostridium folliculivorans]